MIGKQVRVYFNLHKKVYSVQDKKTGLVIAHVDKLSLENVKYSVRQGGRQKVLKEKRKNVHAFIEGTICCPIVVQGDKFRTTYNPYKYDSFVIANSEAKLFNSDYAVLGLIGTKPTTHGYSKRIV